MQVAIMLLIMVLVTPLSWDRYGLFALADSRVVVERTSHT
jgi:hypothetical protein